MVADSKSACSQSEKKFKKELEKREAAEIKQQRQKEAAETKHQRLIRMKRKEYLLTYVFVSFLSTNLTSASS